MDMLKGASFRMRRIGVFLLRWGLFTDGIYYYTVSILAIGRLLLPESTYLWNYRGRIFAGFEIPDFE